MITGRSDTRNNHNNAPESDKILLCAIENDADKAKVFEFMQHIFRVEEPITRTIGSSEWDTYEFYKDICESGFNGAHSIIAKDVSGIIAGICLNAIFIGEVGSENAKTDFRDVISSIKPTEPPNNYDEEISKGPYPSRNANRLSAIIDLSENGMKDIVKRSTKTLKIDILSVHPNFMKMGLGSRMVDESLKLARRNGCNLVYSVASAAASRRIFHKFGFQMIREVAFESFLENGEVVFKNLHDRNTGIALMILPL